MCKIILPKIILNVEKWKWNAEYRVYVSNMGHFKDEHKKLLPIKISGSGYCKVKTSCGFKSVHRIVMLTWKPIPDAENLTVDHLDHNKRNNAVSNLEWVTETENLKRAAADFINIEEEKIGNTKRIKTGGLTFNNITEAALWTISHHGMKETSNEKIEKKILTAIADNKKYCGRKWQEV